MSDQPPATTATPPLEAASTPPGESVARWIEGHLALITSVGGVLLISSKLYVVSHFRIDTALALLDAASVLTLVAGALILSVPLMAVWALFVSAAYILAALEARQPVHLFAALAWVFAALLSPWFWAAISMAVILLLLGRRLLRGQRPQASPAEVVGDCASNQPPPVRRLSPLGQVGLFLLLAMLLGFFLMDDRVWLPAESMGVADGSESVVYVVAERGGWTVVLDHRDRVVRFVESDSIRSRRVCSTRPPVDPFFSAPQVVQLLIRISPEDIDRCPDRPVPAPA